VSQRCSRRSFLARTAGLAGALCVARPLSVEASASGPQRPLILVHGFADQAATWRRSDNAIVNRLIQAGYSWDSLRLNAFAFPSLAGWPDLEDSQGDIATAGAALAELIRGLAGRSADGQVDLLGFSMGGLVSRWAINSLRDASSGQALVNQAVILATPNAGADILLFLSKLSQRNQATVRDLAREMASFDLDSIGARQMLPQSEFLDWLNRPELADDRVRFTTIAGAADLYVRTGPLRTKFGIGDGVLSSSSAAFVPGVATRAYQLPETLGADGESPWRAIQSSAVYHPHLLLNDFAALIAAAELAPELPALQNAVDGLIDQGGIRRASST
jgi:pimeloyl-ACP methyl ester carboxylesterase